MTFDWPTFLHAHHIEYVERGPSVVRGNIAVHCPFCPDDPSQHMGINLDGKGWGCWRNNAHRGRSPVRLIAALAKISLADAYKIAGYDQHLVPEDFLSAVRSKLVVDALPPTRAVGLTMPPEFHKFKWSRRAEPFYHYLERRGYSQHDIRWMSYNYGMRYAIRPSPWHGRIIFPVYYHGQLVSWTGRHIGQSTLRYMTVSTDADEEPRAPSPITDHLLWFDQLMESQADLIYVTEGPFDALKLSVLGFQYGVVATCLFTSTPSDAQIAKLELLLPRFKKRYLLLDMDMTVRSYFDWALPGLLVAKRLPAGVKDPGDLTSSTFREINA